MRFTSFPFIYSALLASLLALALAETDTGPSRRNTAASMSPPSQPSSATNAGNSETTSSDAEDGTKVQYRTQLTTTMTGGKSRRVITRRKRQWIPRIPDIPRIPTPY